MHLFPRNPWIALALALALPLRADEISTFATSLNLGATLTEGNSETRQLNISLISEGERNDLGAVRTGLEANYGEAKVDGVTETHIENTRAFLNLRKTLADWAYVSTDASVLYDAVADVDYRVMLGPALGLFLYRDDRAELTAEAGPSYLWERVGGDRDNYLALRFAQRLTVALSESAKFWQSLEYVPQVDDFDNYLAQAELGVEAAMTTRMNLRVVLKYAYDSTPAEGLEKGDLVLMAGVGFRL